MPPRRGRPAEKVFEKLFQSGPGLARKEGTGHVVTLAMEGIAQFRRYLELFLPKMISMAVIPPAVVCYVFLKTHPPLQS